MRCRDRVEGCLTSVPEGATGKFGNERRDVTVDDLPDDVYVDVEVAVRKDVTHSDYVGPDQGTSG